MRWHAPTATLAIACSGEGVGATKTSLKTPCCGNPCLGKEELDALSSKTRVVFDKQYFFFELATKHAVVKTPPSHIHVSVVQSCAGQNTAPLCGDPGSGRRALTGTTTPGSVTGASLRPLPPGCFVASGGWFTQGFKFFQGWFSYSFYGQGFPQHVGDVRVYAWYTAPPRAGGWEDSK